MASKPNRNATDPLYKAKERPEFVDVPTLPFVQLDGQGDPGGEPFSLAIQALYAFSYAVKMSYRSKDVPADYREYRVFPLEGVWDLVDPGKGLQVKENLRYTLMIRQPDFLTDALFDRFREEVRLRKPLLPTDRLRFVCEAEGPCCQMLHVGAYADEPRTMDIMESFCRQEGVRRVDRRHREIYLSDPGRTAPDRIRTILRFRVVR